MSKADALSILAVEDEALIAMELEDMLRELGHEVIGPAPTINAALSLLRTTHPDAAVVDANLAGQHAGPIIEALRENGIPVILTSGYEMDELRSLGLDAPLVRKPYGMRDLAKALQAIRCPSTQGN